MASEDKLLSFKSNTGQVFWYGLGSFSTFAFGIIMSAILARVLDISDYGTYRQLFYIYNTLLVIFTAGLPKAYSYFLAKVDMEEGKDVVSKLTKPLLIFGLIFSVTLYFCSDVIAVVLKNPELSNGLKIFSPIPFLLLPTLGIEGIYAALKRSHIVTIYHAVTKFVMLMVVIGALYFYGFTYEYAVYGWIVGALFSFIFALRLKFKPFQKYKNRISGVTYGRIFTYAVPLMTASIYGIAFRSADKFYISRYFGEEVFAVYSNGFTQLPFVTMIVGATSAILIPAFSRFVDDPTKKEKILETWINVWEKSSLLIYPMLIYFFAYAKNVIIILYGDKYVDSIIFFQIYIFVSFFDVIMYLPIILALGETKFYAKVHLVIAILIWLICYLVLIFEGGALAIGMVFVALNAFKSIWFMIFISKKMEWKIFDLIPLKHISKVLIQSIIVVSIVYWSIYSLNLSLILELIFTSALYFLLLMISSSVFKLDYIGTVKPLLQK